MVYCAATGSQYQVYMKLCLGFRLREQRHTTARAYHTAAGQKPKATQKEVWKLEGLRTRNAHHLPAPITWTARADSGEGARVARCSAQQGRFPKQAPRLVLHSSTFAASSPPPSNPGEFVRRQTRLCSLQHGGAAHPANGAAPGIPAPASRRF
jgi:hypothetical protein